MVLIALAQNNSSITPNNLRKDEKGRLIKIEKYIQSHLKVDLNIEKLSMLAGFSTSKFKKEFKSFFGTTVFKYITSLRIEKAIELIIKKEYPIAQASYEVGYKTLNILRLHLKRN